MLKSNRFYLLLDKKFTFYFSLYKYSINYFG